MELSKAIIEKWAGPEILAEAEKRVKNGAVMKAEVSGDTIAGLFAQPTGPVKCSFKVKSNGLVESHCTCWQNRNSGTICVHVVALALSVMQRLNDPVRQQRYIEEQRHAKRIEEAIAAAFPRSPRGIPSKLLIELPGDFTAQFAKGAVTLRALVLVGDAGRPVLLENIPRNKPLSFPEDDDTVIDVLEDMSESGLKSTITLVRIDFLGLLDVCRGRSLYIAGAKPIQVQPKAAPFTVLACLDRTNGNLLLKAHMRGDGAENSPRPVFLAELEKSFALADGRLWPLKPTLPLPYHGLYTGDITIPRTGILSFITGELPQLDAKLPFAFEDGLSPDCFTLVPGKPHFTLTLSGSTEAASAKLEASYSGKNVAAGAPEVPGAIAEPDPEDFLNFLGRDLPAERRALSRLTAGGFRGATGDALDPVLGERKVLNILGGLVPPLRRLGWTVNVVGRLGKFFDAAAMTVPVVNIDAARATRSHFEVSIRFEDDTRRNLPQPLLQQAIKRGDSFFDCDDGRRLLIDRDAVESMRRVFNDCESRPGKAPGSFELPAVYAPYVDSSLAALDGIDVELPDAWRKRAAQCNRDAKIETEALGELDGVLRPYQKTGVYWMRFLEKSGFGGILADEMGLGKTLQTLTWLSLPRIHAAADGKTAPALIVAPTSLVENWKRECEKFTPWRKCLVMQGAERHELWGEVPGHDIVITSYALLRRDLDHYSDFTFSAAVLDEAQHIKNRSTQNAIAAKSIRAQARLVLTGTPVENGVADIWSIMDFLMPGYLESYDNFKVGYELPIAAGGSAGEDAQLRLHRKLRPFLLRRVKREVAKDLPEKIQQTSFSTLAPEQGKIYAALLEVFREKINKLVADKGFDHCRMDVLAVLLRLRQACCHLSLLPPEMLGKTSPEEPSGKLAQFLDILDEAIDGGHRMLVFSQFVGMLTVLRKTLDSRGVKYCYLDGSTKDRLGECRKFNQDATIPVFLISLKAGGTGLNLTGADMVVHFDPWWNPAVEDQATDRAHRIGQKRTVCSIKLIAKDTVEEKVLEMQRKKQSVIKATVGTDDSAIMQSLTWDDIKGLLS